MQIHTALDWIHSKFKFLGLLRRSVSTVSTQQPDSSGCLPCCFHTVSVAPPPAWVLVCRPPVAAEHFTGLHQRENKRTEPETRREGGHQRPSPSTVSTCCSIPVLTADEALHKQPAQILPAGRSHSTSLGVVYGRVGGGQREGN